MSESGQKRREGEEEQLGLWNKPRQLLPSKRDAHSQQWGLGVAALYVLHDHF